MEKEMMEQIASSSARNRVETFEKVMALTVLYLIYKDSDFKKKFEPVLKQIAEVSGQLFLAKLEQDAEEFKKDKNVPEVVKEMMIEHLFSAVKRYEPAFYVTIVENWCSKENFNEDGFLIPENYPKFMDSILDFTNSIKK